MPYTLAHPITAIALAGFFPKRLNKTGLVVGSVAPDLLNFVMLRPTDTSFFHSHAGLWSVGLPASVALSFLFHRLLLPATAPYLPQPLDRIAGDYVQQGWRIAGVKAWIMLLGSIVLGMYSHLFLDGFTHRGGLMYPLATAWTATLFPHVDSPAMLLQFGLSVFGLIAELLLLGVLIWRRRKTGRPSGTPTAAKWRYWAVVSAFACAVLLLALVLHGTSRYRWAIVFMLPVASVSGAAVGLVTASLLYTWYRASRAPRDIRMRK